mgnify:CR=1 FL=1
MGLTERIVGWFGGVPQAQVEKRAVEAYKSGYNDGGEDEPHDASCGGIIGEGEWKPHEEEYCD